MKFYQNLILVFSLQTLASTCLALTALQYCEKLHVQRPEGVSTSYELLNAESPTTSVITYTVPLNRWGVSAPITPVYTISVLVKKICKNGVFVFQKLMKTTWINQCDVVTHETGCPAEGSSCENESGVAVACI